MDIKAYLLIFINSGDILNFNIIISTFSRFFNRLIEQKDFSL